MPSAKGSSTDLATRLAPGTQETILRRLDLEMDMGSAAAALGGLAALARPWNLQKESRTRESWK